MNGIAQGVREPLLTFDTTTFAGDAPYPEDSGSRRRRLFIRPHPGNDLCVPGVLSKEGSICLERAFVGANANDISSWNGCCLSLDGMLYPLAVATPLDTADQLAATLDEPDLWVFRELRVIPRVYFPRQVMNLSVDLGGAKPPQGHLRVFFMGHTTAAA